METLTVIGWFFFSQIAKVHNIFNNPVDKTFPLKYRSILQQVGWNPKTIRKTRQKDRKEQQIYDSRSNI